MKAKKLLILCAVAAALIGLAVRSSSHKQRNREATADIDKPLLTALQDTGNVAKIHRLIFESAASTITVEQTDNGWVAASKYGYPVDFNKIRAFVDTLAKLKTSQPLLSNTDQLRELQLLAPVSGQSDKPAGVVVSLQDKDGKDIVSLIVGKERKKEAPPGMGMPGMGGYTDGRFVAVEGNAYLVAEALYDLPEQDASWFKTELVSVVAADINAVTVRSEEGKTLTLTRTAPGADLTVGDLKKKEEMESGAVSGLANTLSYLSFTDVVDPAVDDKVLGLDRPITATFETKNGQTYLLRVGYYPGHEETKALRINVSYKAPEKPEAATDEEAEADDDAVDEVAEATKKLNDRIGKWVYIVQAYKVDDLIVARDKFVKEKGSSEEVHGPNDGHGH